MTGTCGGEDMGKASHFYIFGIPLCRTAHPLSNGWNGWNGMGRPRCPHCEKALADRGIVLPPDPKVRVPMRDLSEYFGVT